MLILRFKKIAKIKKLKIFIEIYYNDWQQFF